MRVRISYTVDVDEDTRRAIRAYHDEEGLATREEIKSWFISHGLSMDDELSVIIGRLYEEDEA